MWSFVQNDDGSAEIKSRGFDPKTVAKVDRLNFFNANHKDAVQLFDDFLGDAVDARWSGGAGTYGTAPAILAGGAHGVADLVAGVNASGTKQLNVSSLTHALNWKPENGALVIEARVKISAVADSIFGVGFTDVLATTTAETPFTVSGTTLTDTCTDGVALMFDDGQTAKNLSVAATKNNTEQWAALGASYAADTSYHVLRVEIDTSGHAKFYVDGVFVYGLANAVTASVALTPVIFCSNDNDNARTLSVDYVWVAQRRT